MVDLDFSHFVCSVKFDVVDADIPCILGMPFLKAYNPIVNWKKQFLTFNRGGK